MFHLDKMSHESLPWALNSLRTLTSVLTVTLNFKRIRYIVHWLGSILLYQGKRLVKHTDI